MFKHITKNIGHDLKMSSPNDNAVVVVNPIMWLPRRQSMHILAVMQELNLGDLQSQLDDPTRMNAAIGLSGPLLEKMSDVMPYLIASWTLVGPDGNTLPLPNVDRPETNDLPINIMMYLLGAAGEDDDVIPPANALPSEISSSEKSKAAQILPSDEKDSESSSELQSNPGLQLVNTQPPSLT